MKSLSNTSHMKQMMIMKISLIFICIACVLLTHPFLKLPYDPWEHLIKIRSIFDEGRCSLFWPEYSSGFCAWHAMWAYFFSALGIDETLLWASIIHWSQSIFALLCLYFFSSSAIRLADISIPPHRASLTAIWATIFWLIGNGTFSVDYQNAWIVWYSVTYQGLTIPLFWLMVGLTLHLFFNADLRAGGRSLIILLIIAGFSIITFFHPSEAVYYLVYGVISVFFTPLLSVKQKTALGFLLITVLPALLFLIARSLQLPILAELTSVDGLSEIVHQIQLTGVRITEQGGNRLLSTFSELAILSLVFALLFYAMTVIPPRLRQGRVFALLLISMVFFSMIPAVTWVAGTVGVLLHEDIVWRFIFASPWFVFLPYIVLKLSSNNRFGAVYSSVVLCAIIAGTTYASDRFFNQALSGNISSLMDSFSKQKIGLQYSENDLNRLEQIIKTHLRAEKNQQKNMLYMRGDLSILARALYGYNSFAHRRVSIPMYDFYKREMDKNYNLVPVRVPKDYPKSRDIFLKFNLDAQFISQKVNTDTEGNSPVNYYIDHIDVGKDYLVIEGWAFFKDDSTDSDSFLVLESNSNTYVYDTSEVFRSDLGTVFKSSAFENRGFLATINLENIDPDNYQVGVLVKGDEKKQGIAFSRHNLKLP